MRCKLMSDNEQSEDSAEIEIYKGRRVAYYAALVEAWIGTRMERDKQILALSSLGLGGLIALEQAGLENTTSFGLWVISGLLFLTAIFLALIILSLNANYIQKLAHDHESTDHEGALRTLDKVLMTVFFLGVLSAFSLAVHETDFALIKKSEVAVHEQKQ